MIIIIMRTRRAGVPTPERVRATLDTARRRRLLFSRYES